MNTTEDFLRQLENDPDYMQRTREQDAHFAEYRRQLTESERPIVADIVKAGTPVESVWDLVNTSTPYPQALPVLIKHLQRGGYMDRVMESLGRALAVKPSIRYWDILKHCFYHSRSEGEHTGAALALSACVTKERIDDLIQMIQDEELGDDRLFFVGDVLRLGGERGKAVIDSLQDDPDLHKEIAAHLRRRKKRQK